MIMKKYVDQTKYRSLIGSLLYLTMFVVCTCARFQYFPKKSHLSAAIRILKYLQGTKDVRLWYLSHVPLNLVGYTNSNLIGCKLDRKSTSDTGHLLGFSLISWHYKKQACVALSTTETKYIATRSCCAHILWLKQQLSDFRVNLKNLLQDEELFLLIFLCCLLFPLCTPKDKVLDCLPRDFVGHLKSNLCLIKPSMSKSFLSIMSFVHNLSFAL